MFGKKVEIRQFSYTSIFYKPAKDDDNEKQGKRKIKFDRFPREHRPTKPIFYYLIITAFVIYILYLLGYY